MKTSKNLISLFITIVLVLTMVLTCAFSASAATIYYGDADKDGSITAADARLVLRAAVKLDTYSSAELFRYDIDGNSVVSADDARSVLRMAVSLDAKKIYYTSGSGSSSGGSSSSGSSDAKYTELIRKITTQINYLTDGDFYLDAATVEANGDIGSPMIIACTKNTMYFSSDFGDFELGILTKGQGTSKKIYMISDEHKTYIQLTDAVLAMMGMNKSDINLDIDFSSTSVEGYPYVVKETANGYVVTFTMDDGSKCIVAADKTGTITRITSYDSDGTQSSDMMIYDIEDNAPASKTSIPSSYTNSVFATAFFTKIMAN